MREKESGMLLSGVCVLVTSEKVNAVPTSLKLADSFEVVLTGVLKLDESCVVSLHSLRRRAEGCAHTHTPHVSRFGNHLSNIQHSFHMYATECVPLELAGFATHLIIKVIRAAPVADVSSILHCRVRQKML